MTTSLGLMFDESCKKYANNVATIYDGQQLSYSSLNQAVNSLGNELKSLGIKKGDNVGIMISNRPEFVISYFAVQKIGAVAVTLNVLSTSHELRYFLGNSDAKCLITEASLIKRFNEIRADLPLCAHAITTGETFEAYSDFRSIIEKNTPPLDPLEMADDDPAVIIYTSGLTGKQLGAVLTHRNLFTQSNLVASIYDGTEKDRSLAIIPLFHAFGAVANMLGAIRMGASIVLMDRFSLDSIFSTIEKERVTYIAAVPRLFLGMVFHTETEKYDISSLRFCITGGSAMQMEFIAPFEEKFNVILREGYGLTEASPVCSVCRREMPNKPGSVGTVIPGTEAKVFDDHGNELPIGEIGELVIRGNNVMKGYYKDEAATAAVIKNGWLFTGDLARMDEDGYIFLTGRKKRMIITSGFNVYPLEIEQILSLHPGVLTSSVIGKPDLLRGEIVKALVVKRPNFSVDEKAITRHCREYLSSYKIPREIEFVESIDDIPK